MEPVREKWTQNVVLENREKLEISGADEVNNFDEKQIIAFTKLGSLIIKGENLHIQKFNNKTGELNITGKVDEMKYSSGKKRDKKNFLSRIFK